MKVIYSRVSTENQTLEQQISAVHEIVPNNGQKPLLLSEKVCGWDNDGRKQYNALKKLINTGKVTDLYVYAIDRLGRDAREVYEFFQTCKDKGVSIHSVTERIDTSSPFSDVIMLLIATIAEMERKKISERTRAKFAHYRKEFNYKCHGSPKGWWSKKYIDLEQDIRAFYKIGNTINQIAKRYGLDWRRVKKLLETEPGTLRSKKQVAKENPDWYKTPDEQREEYKQAHTKS